MATKILGEYATVGGAVVAVTEKSLFGFIDLLFTARCGGCGESITHRTDGTADTPAQSEARTQYWAAEHAGTCCRRLLR